MYIYIYHNFSFKWKTKNAEEMFPQISSFSCISMFSKESPRTVGACVWTTEDLEKNPSAWEHREATPEIIVNCGSGGVLGEIWSHLKLGMEKWDETKMVEMVDEIYKMYTLGFQKTIKRMGGFI